MDLDALANSIQRAKQIAELKQDIQLGLIIGIFVFIAVSLAIRANGKYLARVIAERLHRDQQ